MALCLRILNKQVRQITYSFYTRHPSENLHRNTPFSSERHTYHYEILFFIQEKDTKFLT